MIMNFLETASFYVSIFNYIMLFVVLPLCLWGTLVRYCIIEHEPTRRVIIRLHFWMNRIEEAWEAAAPKREGRE